jgi:tripartite-type tricarboxylate transporter receptor subunit TctC
VHRNTFHGLHAKPLNEALSASDGLGTLAADLRKVMPPRWFREENMASRLCGASLALAFGALSTFSAVGQDYPTRQINMVIPFPPGGNTDLMARALQPELAKALGQSVIAVNKGGAGGTIGNIEVASSRPDGYTIGLTPNNPLTAQPHVQNLPYGMDSFKYVCLTYYVPYVVMASPKAPFKTFEEFVAFTKTKADNLLYASPGPGTQPHLGILSALGAIKGEGVHVPFTGAGPMSQAMLAGTVMAMSESTAVAKASNLVVLAAQTKERIPSLPDVKTMAELGFPSEAFSAGGLVVPAATPDAVVAKLQTACAQAVASEGYKAATEKLNAVARYLPGPEFRKMFDEDSARNAAAVKAAGLARK